MLKIKPNRLYFMCSSIWRIQRDFDDYMCSASLAYPPLLRIGLHLSQLPELAQILGEGNTGIVRSSFARPSLCLYGGHMVSIWCLYGSYMVPPYFLRSSITLPSLPTPCPSPCLFWNFAFQHPSHDMMALSPARILRGMHRFVPAIDIIYAWTQAGRRFALS